MNSKDWAHVKAIAAQEGVSLKEAHVTNMSRLDHALARIIAIVKSRERA